MVDLNSSPSNEKPNLDVLFPELKKSQTAIRAPRFMAPATAAASLLKGAPQSARVVPPPPSLRGKPASVKPASVKPASVKPPPPSARFARPAPEPEQVHEVEVEELLTTSPDASAAPLEPIHPVDDEYEDEGPTVARPSPLLFEPSPSRPVPSAPRPSSPVPPPSRRAAPPPSATKLPPVPVPPPSLRSVAPPSLPKASPQALPQAMAEHETETFAPPPVSSKAARASAAANLVAGSGPHRNYAPPSVRPPVSRPLTAQETIPASRAHSLIPTVMPSVPPPSLPAPRKSRGGFIALAAVASLAVFGALGFGAIKGSSVLGLGSAGTGSLAVTAAGPNGAKVDGLRVLVDGAVKCEGAPCRVADLTTGTHFISADAPGFSATAARAVAVERGGAATLHIDLVPSTPAPQAALAPKAEAEPTPVDQLQQELKQEEAARHASHSAPVTARSEKSEKKSSKPAETTKADSKNVSSGEAQGDGTLNINSIPVANVVLDGRPVGSTPLIGLKVSPGPHSVVFVHPELGRKASGTSVKAGKSATVAVRF